MGRKLPDTFAFLLSKHRPLPPDVRPVVQRRDADTNPACSKVQRYMTFMVLETIVLALSDTVHQFTDGTIIERLVKEPNMFHNNETEKITRKASDAAENLQLY